VARCRRSGRASRLRASARPPRTCRDEVPTPDSYRWVIGKYLQPALGPKWLAALTVDDVEAVLRSRAARRIARSSVVRA
jgi:hypothetical protein